MVRRRRWRTAPARAGRSRAPAPAPGRRGWPRCRRQHRHRRLRQNRALVHRLRDQVHRAAVQLHSRGERARMRVQPRKCRQQARVDVQHAALPDLDQERRQQSHVAGEADDLDAGLAQRRIDRRLVRGAVGAEAAGGRSPAPERPPAGPAPDPRRPAGSRSPDTISAGIFGVPRRRDQRGHVGATAADQDGGPAPHPGRLTVDRLTQASRPAARSAPSAVRSRPRCGRCGRRSRPAVAQQFGGGVGVGHDQRHADPAVEHAQHLVGRDAAGPRQPAEHRRHRPVGFQHRHRARPAAPAAGCPAARRR